MSTAEQDAALLRIVKDRAEAKRKRSLLEHEIRSTGTAFYEVGSSLRNMSLHSDRQSFSKQLEKHQAHMPESVSEMVKDYFSECDRVEELDARAKEQHID
ncbi:MAG: hypothetical protein ABI833_11395 [Acidobacteriota bacterium]